MNRRQILKAACVAPLALAIPSVLLTPPHWETTELRFMRRRGTIRGVVYGVTGERVRAACQSAETGKFTYLGPRNGGHEIEVAWEFKPNWTDLDKIANKATQETS